jgi:hypothetical protein
MIFSHNNMPFFQFLLLFLFPLSEAGRMILSACCAVSFALQAAGRDAYNSHPDLPNFRRGAADRVRWQ